MQEKSVYWVKAVEKFQHCILNYINLHGQKRIWKNLLMNKKKIAVKVKKKFSFNICNDVSEGTCKLVFPTLFHIVKKSARQIIVPTMSKCYISAYYEDNFKKYIVCV